LERLFLNGDLYFFQSLFFIRKKSQRELGPAEVEGEGQRGGGKRRKSFLEHGHLFRIREIIPANRSILTGRLSPLICPPIKWASRFEIDRPNPVPPKRRAMAHSF
jgi:hypothetical protein